ncbi:MAG: SusE domain-containing protein, partial [Bacteroidota bacterium]
IIKRIVYITMALGLIVFTNSCEEDPVFFADESTAITLEETTITLIIVDGDNPNNPAITFNWTNANFDQAVAENYSVEFSATADFASSAEATSTIGSSSVTMSMSQMNSAADAIGLDPLQQSTVYARVVGSLGVQDQLPVISNVINFDVVPFFNYGFEDYYIVGNGTSADWNNNNNNPPLFRDPNNSDFYTYTGFFTKGGGGFDDGRFKVLENRGQWQPQWGVSADEGSDNILTSGGIAGNPATQDNDPGRFGVPSSGYYTFTIDFASMTYTTLPFDDSSGTDFTSMTLQGSGVSQSVSMTQSTFDSHLWFVNNVVLVPGELQFLTNAGSTWAGATEFSGVATEGSGSIPVVVEDEYEVWFNDLTGDYIMIPLNL